MTLGQWYLVMLFSQIIGHEDIKAKLIQSVKENRVAHAQLFLGQEGTGKLALAIAYAQYINCANRGEYDSCGECLSCKKYNALAHPDLHFIFPTTTNKNVKKDPESDMFVAEWREYLENCDAYADLSSWYNKLDVENKQGAINVRDAATIMRKLNLKSYEAEYKVAIIWMAEKLNIPFVDTRHWNIELTFNGVHFTEEGHHSFANHLMEVIP